MAEAGVYHRDLTLDNVLVFRQKQDIDDIIRRVTFGEEPEVNLDVNLKICDFGIGGNDANKDK